MPNINYKKVSLYNYVMSENGVLIERIVGIEKEVKKIKEHMVDIDNIMTENDYKDLIDYRIEKKSKKLVSHEKLKKELGL